MLYPVRKGLPFYHNLLVLKLAGYYPKSSNYNKKLFFYCLVCWMSIWTGTLWNLIILLYLSIQNKSSHGITEAMGYLIGNSSLALICLHFALKHQDWSHLMDALIDFQKYGKPPKFNTVQTNASKVGITFFKVLFCAAVMYCVLQVLLEEECEKKLTFGKTSCGMLLPTWFPASHAESKLAKRLLLIYQLLACWAIAPFTVIVSLVLQANEFIAYRIDHLKSLLRKVGSNENPDLQLHQFLAYVQYHHHIIRLCRKLNYVAKYTTGHVALTFVTVVACFGHHSIQEKSLQSLTYQATYVISMCILCYAGQNMQDQMRSIGDALYSSTWYNCSLKVQKMIPLVLLRTQQPIGLDAVPLGVFNYMLMVMVLKTTYSYMSFLSRTI
ncbi:hypothetical protein HUJ04_006345 [Dendroctonus ponderosae]|uniref:Odorant receptor n=1 Tax=Dendroctonus ponderosae TaxID=77166 RepID=A0AAR5PMZ2_DENPD|nr:hypothetical protein HUJ04_006345 [Dendroctonus ponderosae]